MLDNENSFVAFHLVCCSLPHRRELIGQSVLENHGHLLGYAKMPHIFENESDRLELIEQAIQLTPSYAANYSKQDEKQQRNFRYRALNFIADMKRKLINEANIAKQTKDKNNILLYYSYQDILKSQNAIDFDDLLLKVYYLFNDYPKIAALYRRSFFAMCVDFHSQKYVAFRHSPINARDSQAQTDKNHERYPQRFFAQYPQYPLIGL
jgi:hypothetical protein